MTTAEKHGPDRPVAYEKADVHALKQLAVGEASPDQQKRALSFILRVICRVEDWPYFPTERHTDLMLGRQFVGHQIKKLVSLPETVLEKDKSN